jgi:uncharacterized phage protein (TIGR02218 family)
VKTISLALKSHLEQEVTTLATCWKATLTNGDVFGFTNHTENITFDSIQYLASTGYTPTSVTTSGDFSVDNLDVEALLSDDSISAGDLLAGLWDFAEIEIFEVNYKELTQGALKLRKGWLGEVSAQKSSFIAELRGLMQKLQQGLGRVISPSCDAILGDARCKKDLTAFTFSKTVDAVVSQREFNSALVQANGYFDYGLVIWTSGLNTGLSMEVKTYMVGSVILQLPMPYAINVTDTFDIVAGCAKRHDEDCIAKFNNVINFRGYPHVPGTDELVKGPA